MDSDPTNPIHDHAPQLFGCMTVPVVLIGWLLHLIERLRHATLTVRWLFERRDLWVGVYWDTEWFTEWAEGVEECDRLHLYVCIVPLLPIHFQITFDMP